VTFCVIQKDAHYAKSKLFSSILQLQLMNHMKFGMELDINVTDDCV